MSRNVGTATADSLAVDGISSDIAWTREYSAVTQLPSWEVIDGLGNYDVIRLEVGMGSSAGADHIDMRINGSSTDNTYHYGTQSMDGSGSSYTNSNTIRLMEASGTGSHGTWYLQRGGMRNQEIDGYGYGQTNTVSKEWMTAFTADIYEYIRSVGIITPNDDTHGVYIGVWGGKRPTPSAPELDSFDDYNSGFRPPGYYDATGTGNVIVENNQSYSGSNSLYDGDETGSSGTNDFVPHVQSFRHTRQYTTLEAKYYETSSGTGGAIRWLGHGGELCSVGTSNPQYSLHSGDGGEFVASGSTVTPSYGEWRRVEVTVDWESNTFDVLFEDLGGSTPDQTMTDKPFVGDPTDIFKVEIGHDSRGDPNMGSAGNIWWDDTSTI